MSNLTSIEKLKLEKLLEMESGYVLDFSNFTFQEFILENLNIDIYDEKYNYRSGSKANRLRGFWAEEPNQVVGELLEKLLEYWRTKRLITRKAINSEDDILFNECQKIIERLKGNSAKKKVKRLKSRRNFIRFDQSFYLNLINSQV